MPLPDIREQAVNRWPSILAALGVPEAALVDRHGPCPMCGGKDRFRFDDKDGTGTWFCNQCKAGDGISLAMKFKGVDFKEAARLVRETLPSTTVAAPKPEQAPADTKARLKAMWEWAKRTAPMDDVDAYLRGRGLGMDEYPKALRTHSALPYWDDARKKVGEFPAMLAAITGADGKMVAIHRTYLKDGKKADVPSPKKVAGKMAGGSIKLYPATEILCVTEGIETALAVRRRTWLPVWSLVSAGQMENFDPPAGLKVLRIYADHDSNCTGQRAAYILAHRVAQKGLKVSVHIPTTEGTDWSDGQEGLREKL